MPLFGIALLEIGVIARTDSPERTLMIHAMRLALFLVLGHVAMVFGMLDPYLGMPGATPPAQDHMH